MPNIRRARFDWIDPVLGRGGFLLFFSFSLGWAFYLRQLFLAPLRPAVSFTFGGVLDGSLVATNSQEFSANRGGDGPESIPGCASVLTDGTWGHTLPQSGVV